MLYAKTRAGMGRRTESSVAEPVRGVRTKPEARHFLKGTVQLLLFCCSFIVHLLFALLESFRSGRDDVRQALWQPTGRC